ncbi:rRNA methyltransferase 3A, mitochondrial isoform X2 [Rhodnius prolixus]
MLKVKSKKARLKSGLIALEGKRLIENALQQGLQPEMIFYSRRKDIEELKNLNSEILLYKLPYKDLQLWSDLTTSPGIIAFCKKPGRILNENSLPVTVVCDNVREPGNLGAIIRSSAAAGVQRVVLIKGCVDVWDSKVLRGASGAHFHLPILEDITWNDLTKQLTDEKNTKLLLAVNQPSTTILRCLPYFQVEYNKSDNIIIVVGGETEGLSEEVFKIARTFHGKALNIPLSNNIESLNCVSAVSVILFEIKRQLSL